MQNVKRNIKKNKTMIVDELKNWEHYHFDPAWKNAFEFLVSLSPESEEKTYTLQGDDIYAPITRYKTRSKESALFQTH